MVVKSDYRMHFCVRHSRRCQTDKTSCEHDLPHGQGAARMKRRSLATMNSSKSKDACSMLSIPARIGPSDTHFVNPNGLPEDWPGVRAPFVLALAIQRFRLLNRALGTRVTSIDVDAPKAST
jgi:hypothetical protein